MKSIWRCVKSHLIAILNSIGFAIDTYLNVLGAKKTFLTSILSIVLNAINWFNTYLQSGGNGNSSTSASNIINLHPQKSTLKNSKPLFKKVIAIFCITAIATVYLLNYFSYKSSACQPFSPWEVLNILQDNYKGITARGIYAQKMIDNQCIGISDGGFHLDNPQTSQLSFSDSGVMDSAARAYRKNSIEDANNSWKQARNEGVSFKDTTEYDAEPWIYLEDQKQLSSNSQNYYDIAAVTMLSGQDDEAVDIGRNELRGFYIALNDYNSHKRSNMPSIRLLIANIGGLAAYANQVEEQIKTLAENDPHLIGILGWPISGSENVLNAIKDLEQTGLPIISPTATADDLSQLNSYYFRMAPKNEVQAVADVSLVEKVYQNMLDNPSLKRQLLQNKSPEQLSNINVVMLTENKSLYSSSLSHDFKYLVYHPQFLGFNLRYSINIIQEDNFDQNSITKEQIDKIVSQKPDIIYMSGYSQDAQTVLTDLQLSDPNNLIKLVGGDGFAYIRDYPDPVYPTNIANDRLYYTSFSSPVSDCIAAIHNTDFYGRYYGFFHVCAGNDAMLAHDAAFTMFNEIESLQQEDNIKAYRSALWKALKQIDKYHPLSDPNLVTGTVTFDGGERVDPIITFFHVTNNQILPFS